MNILITSVGRRDYIVEYFRAALNGGGQIVAANSLEHCSGMYASDVRCVVPPVHSKEYIPCLLDICRAHEIRMVLSLMDQDSLVLSTHRKSFADLGVFVAASEVKTLELAFDKYESGKFLTSLGILTPTTVRSPEEALHHLENGVLSFPLILKPRWGSGSICTEVAQTREELLFFFQYLGGKVGETHLAEHANTKGRNEILIQQFIKGDEFDLDVLNDFQGRYVTTFPRKKFAMRAGETDGAVTIANESLRALGERIALAFGHLGILDVDLFCTENGGFTVIDVNPRFGGAYPFSHIAGANVPACYISWVQGKSPRKEWLEQTPNVHSVKGVELWKKG